MARSQQALFPFVDPPPTAAEWRRTQEQLDAATIRASLAVQRGQLDEAGFWQALAFYQRLWIRAESEIAAVEGR